MKKKLSLVLATLMLLGLLAGCGGQPAASGDKDTVVVYIGDIFNSMTPYMTTANSDQAVFDQVYETLTVTKDDGTVAPCLAKSWKMSDDCLEYTFQLEEGVKFHNGEVMTADDVVYSFEQYLANPAKNNFVSMIDKVEMVDANTVKVTLNKITPLFLVYINELPILNKKFVEEHNGNISDVACGTGPYKLTSIDLATSAMLERNDDYRLAPAAIEKVELRYVGDRSTASVQLETGDLDIMSIDPSQLVSFENNDKFTVEKVQTLKTALLAINTTVAPLDNKLVRQAMTYAVDKKSIITIAYENCAVPARLQASDTNCFGVDFSDATDFSYNPEKAKELLAEAGYPDGAGFPAVTYLYNTDDKHSAIAEALQSMWKDVLNVDVTLNNQDWNVFLSTRADGNYDMARDGWISDYNDPVSFMDMFMTGNGNNNAQYSNSEYDAMMTKVLTDSDAEDRMELMHKCEDLLLSQDSAIAPLYYYTQPYMMAEGLSGMYYTPLGFFLFTNVTKG